MPHGGVHYPHGTIESAGHSISGHGSTLHGTASSAAGTSLPAHSLGSLGSGTASALQGHIGGVSGHLGSMADRLGAHGDNLVANSTNMRNTDADHANAFSHIGGGSRGPLLLTNGNADWRPVGEHSSIEQLGAGVHRPPLTPAQQAALDEKRADILGRPSTDTSWPSTPPTLSGPRPPGFAPDIPGETHGHTTHGEFKPAQAPPAPNAWQRPQTVGGHVASGDITGPFPAHTLPPPPAGPHGPRPIVHGQGVNVTGGTDASGRPININNQQPNGVYTATNAPLHGPGASVRPGAPAMNNNPNVTQGNKPLSTMFPQGMTSDQVHELGNQAWHGGMPNGGTHQPNNPAQPNGQATTWHGQAQVPFTPVWNPGGADHGSGAGNAPNAGHTINVQGFHRPMDPVNQPGVQHPATYFPSANQPPAPPPFDYDNTPPRTYDDPNYPEA
jgi:hypothetical protein